MKIDYFIILLIITEFIQPLRAEPLELGTYPNNDLHLKQLLSAENFRFTSDLNARSAFQTSGQMTKSESTEFSRIAFSEVWDSVIWELNYLNMQYDPSGGFRKARIEREILVPGKTAFEKERNLQGLHEWLEQKNSEAQSGKIFFFVNVEKQSINTDQETYTVQVNNTIYGENIDRLQDLPNAEWYLQQPSNHRWKYQLFHESKMYTSSPTFTFRVGNKAEELLQRSYSGLQFKILIEGEQIGAVYQKPSPKSKAGEYPLNQFSGVKVEKLSLWLYDPKKTLFSRVTPTEDAVHHLSKADTVDVESEEFLHSHRFISSLPGSDMPQQNVETELDVPIGADPLPKLPRTLNLTDLMKEPRFRITESFSNGIRNFTKNYVDLNSIETIREFSEIHSRMVVHHQGRDFPWYFESSSKLPEKAMIDYWNKYALQKCFNFVGSDFEKESQKQEALKWMNDTGIHTPKGEQWFLHWVRLGEYDFQKSAFKLNGIYSPIIQDSASVTCKVLPYDASEYFPGATAKARGISTAKVAGLEEWTMKDNPEIYTSWIPLLNGKIYDSLHFYLPVPTSIAEDFKNKSMIGREGTRLESGLFLLFRGESVGTFARNKNSPYARASMCLAFTVHDLSVWRFDYRGFKIEKVLDQLDPTKVMDTDAKKARDYQPFETASDTVGAPQ